MSILLTRAVFPEHLALLREHFQVVDNQADVPLVPASLHKALAQAEAALITPADRIDAAALDAAPGLRLISTISVGYNHIDIKACTERGIAVTNTPDVLTETTADMAWALLLASARRVTESERWMRDGLWNKWALDLMLGAEVHHTTLGILGMGRIGQAIARRAAGFSMNVIYHNRSRLPESTEADCKAKWVTMQDLLARADHLVLVLPYSQQTHHVIGATELAAMKRGAHLINISRGGLIDENALAAALSSGHLGGAGLDVYEGEPKVNPALLALSNVALTPHLGSATRPTRDAMARLAIANLLAAMAGQKPAHLVDADVWERRRS